MNGNMNKCKVCGIEHNMLITLSPECLEAYEVCSMEEIEKAFEKGLIERYAFESGFTKFDK